MLEQGILKGKVPLTSCLTGLGSKPVKQEVNGTVILPPLVFLSCVCVCLCSKFEFGATEPTPKPTPDVGVGVGVVDVSAPKMKATIIDI
jgi:hypothetical protein